MFSNGVGPIDCLKAYNGCASQITDKRYRVQPKSFLPLFHTQHPAPVSYHLHLIILYNDIHVNSNVTGHRRVFSTINLCFCHRSPGRVHKGKSVTKGCTKGAESHQIEKKKTSSRFESVLLQSRLCDTYCLWQAVRIARIRINSQPCFFNKIFEVINYAIPQLKF